MNALPLNIFLITLLFVTLSAKALAQFNAEDKFINYERIDIDYFNLLIDKSFAREECWVKSATLVALKFVGEFEDASSRVIEIVQKSPEESDAIMVTITDEGLADDSLRSERYKLILNRDKNEIWRIVHAFKSWACWTGRGHQEYSTEKCD